MRRLLLVTERTPGPDRAEYEAAWAGLRDAVVAAGGRAWRFRDPSGGSRRLEFIEWKQGPNGPGILEHPAVRDGLERLDLIAPAERSHIWEESP